MNLIEKEHHKIAVQHKLSDVQLELKSRVIKERFTHGKADRTDVSLVLSWLVDVFAENDGLLTRNIAKQTGITRYSITRQVLRELNGPALFKEISFRGGYCLTDTHAANLDEGQLQFTGSIPAMLTPNDLGYREHLKWREHGVTLVILTDEVRARGDVLITDLRTIRLFGVNDKGQTSLRVVEYEVATGEMICNSPVGEIFARKRDLIARRQELLGLGVPKMSDLPSTLVNPSNYWKKVVEMTKGAPFKLVK